MVKKLQSIRLDNAEEKEIIEDPEWAREIREMNSYEKEDMQMHLKFQNFQGKNEHPAYKPNIYKIILHDIFECFIKLNEGKYYWIAYRDNKKICESVQTFSKHKECWLDLMEAMC